MRAGRVVVGLAAAVLVGSWLPDEQGSPPRPAPHAATPAPAADATPPSPEPSPQVSEVTQEAAVLLRAAPGGDGDSWRDTAGRAHRLGMVDAPEVGECFAQQATDERRRLVAGGFLAHAYARDRYGRDVSLVTAADGTNVNVHLARHGFVDDRYLAQFRHENPALAADLEAAFAAARQEGAGLWRACRSGNAPAPPRSGDCHPDYLTCVPVQGDGSGRGAANDLDCGDLPGRVQLRQPGVDPYRLDADGDGTGCD